MKNPMIKAIILMVIWVHFMILLRINSAPIYMSKRKHQ